MKLHELSPAEGSKKTPKRVGRGMGSGVGKTCGRGQDGQKSRSGYSRKVGFEGGQMPLIRRIPKRGFTNVFAKKYAIINVEDLNLFEDGATVTRDDLAMLVKKPENGVKILANGEIEKKLNIQCDRISTSARNKIEAAGGKVEVI